MDNETLTNYVDPDFDNPRTQDEIERINAWLERIRTGLVDSLRKARLAKYQNKTKVLDGQIKYWDIQVKTLTWLVGINTQRKPTNR